MAASTAAGHDSFEQLVETFSQRVAELKNIALLRVQGVHNATDASCTSKCAISDLVR